MKKKLFKFLNTTAYFMKEKTYLNGLFLLMRKIDKNIELEDEEYYEVKSFLNKIPTNLKTYVDIGAGNGVNGSSVLKLAQSNDWGGLHLESGDVSVLTYLYRKYKNTKIGKIKVTPHNISHLLTGFGVTKSFGYLNLDIDSYDYEVLKEILENGFKPIVASIEINETLPPPVFYFAKYSENLEEYMIDYFFGCSLTAANYLMSKFDYTLSHIYGNNAFFLDKKYFNVVQKSEIDIYHDGYVQMKNRESKFYYNQKVDFLVKQEPSVVCSYFDELWKNKKTKYEMKIFP